MLIYEFFRRTVETFICSEIYFKNIENYKNIINIDITYLRHMLDQMFLNSLINIKINLIGDIKIDYHHAVEDLGITIGKLIKYSIFLNKKKLLNRYGFAYVPLDESLSRSVIDISGRGYISYNVFYNNLYVNNFNINLFYDFLFSFVNNFCITLYIDNLIGFNNHHIFETIFKSIGRSLLQALEERVFLNSSKGIIF